MLRQIPSNDHISNASTINTQPFQHLPKINNDYFNRKLARSKTFLTSNPHVSDIQNPPKKRSKVSLLICSQHNKEFIDDYKDIEIVIIDNGSFTDGTYKLVDISPKCKLEKIGPSKWDEYSDILHDSK